MISFVTKMLDYFKLNKISFHLCKREDYKLKNRVTLIIMYEVRAVKFKGSSIVREKC